MTDKPARPEINVSEHWYVKLPGENVVLCREVVEVTMKTVLLRFQQFDGRELTLTGFHETWRTCEWRYKIEDVEFVEQVK